MKYNPAIVSALYVQSGLPEPVFEYRFTPLRMWRLDVAWPFFLTAIECDGGIWIQGKHSRGAGIKKDWEKRNTATSCGWSILMCEPKEVTSLAVIEWVKQTMDSKEKLP